MAQNLDYKQMAVDIVNLVGGPENVKSLGHCMTRLRFNLQDESKADAEKIRGIKGVLGVVSSGGQFMVILGQNLLPVFEAAQKEFKFAEGVKSNENLDGATGKQPLTFKRAVSAVFGYVSAAVTPMVAGLVAGGMLKVVLLLITLVAKDFSATQTYVLLSGLADAPFFFMPIFIAYGAAVKLGGTPIYAMVCAAALLHGNYTALVAAGDPVNMLGIPVRLVSYSSSLLPALLIALVAYYAEKLFNKIIPGIFKSILVGLCTIFVTMVLGYTVLGPLGGYVGALLSQVFVFLGNTVSPVAVGLLAACLPWLVMCGMHAAIAPFMVQSIADPGYDAVFRPAFILHNMAEGGACIGVGIRAKTAELRSEAFGIAFGCIVAGVTEPAIYGINLPRKKPMIGVMAGGAAGGIVAGIMGARAFSMGYSTVLALPIFQNTILAMALGIVVAIVVAAVVTCILGFEDGEKVAAVSIEELPNVSDDVLVAVADGKMMDITGVSDPTFSGKMMGDGVAFELSGDEIVSPCNGTVEVMADTGHAVGITRPDGTEILIHIGIDTVALNGEGFTTLVKQGDVVKAGQPLVKINRKEIETKGYDPTTMLIITNENGAGIQFKPYGTVHVGEIITM